MNYERDKGIEEVIKVLERLGQRLTPQRIIVAKIILENVKHPPSFKEIHAKAMEQLPRLGVSTTYMIMKMLEEAGIITTFEANGETHIDSPHPHINIVCSHNGKIFDIEDEELTSEIIQAITHGALKEGVKIEKPVVVVKAHCYQN